MARTNIYRSGFQYYGPLPGCEGLTQPIECVIITAKPTTYDLRPGDPVKWVTGSTSTPAYIDHSAPTEGVFGIVADIVQYKRASDGVVVRNGCKYVPAATSWTNDSDRTIVTVWPAESCLFTIHSTTAAASIGYARGYIGKNVAHVALATANSAANSSLGLSGQSIDITAASGSSGGDGFDWRLWSILDAPGNDVTAVDASYVVYANLLSNKAGLRSVRAL
jgi:hypothetical protein